MGTGPTSLHIFPLALLFTNFKGGECKQTGKKETLAWNLRHTSLRQCGIAVERGDSGAGLPGFRPQLFYILAG